MKVKVVFNALMLVLVLAVAPSFAAGAAVTPMVETSDETVVRLSRRLEEIKAIDKSKLSRSEKKALRTEVKEIKQEMAALSGGVYISVGALLLIALLLILLL